MQSHDESTRNTLQRLDDFIEWARQNGIHTTANNTVQNTDDHDNSTNTERVTSRSSQIVSELSRLGSESDVRREVGTLFSPRRSNQLHAEGSSTPTNSRIIPSNEQRDRDDNVPNFIPETPPNRQSRAMRSLTRGNRFSRRIILLPSPVCNSIPRGAFRDHLQQQSLVLTVSFRTGQTSRIVRQQIIMAFQQNGHLMDVRNGEEFVFLNPTPENRSVLEPLEEHQQRLTANMVQNRWRSDRTIYIRPVRPISTYRRDGHFPLHRERELEDASREQHRQPQLSRTTESSTNLTENRRENLQSQGRPSTSNVYTIPDSDSDAENYHDSHDQNVPDNVNNDARLSENSTDPILVTTVNQRENSMAISSTLTLPTSANAALATSGAENDRSGVQIDILGAASPCRMRGDVTVSATATGRLDVCMQTPIRSTLGFTGGYAKQQEVQRQLITDCGNALPFLHLRPLPHLLQQVERDRKLCLILVLRDQTSESFRRFISNYNLIEALNTCGYLWCVKYEELDEEVRPHIILPSDGTAPTLHILCPNAAGRMEIRKTFENLHAINNVDEFIPEVINSIQEAQRRLHLATQSRERALLMEEQNREYENSLQQDIERESRERSVEAVEPLPEIAEQPNDANQPSEVSSLGEEREQALAELHPEPLDGIQIRIMDHAGNSVTRRFLRTDTCQYLYRTVFALMDVPRNFKISYFNRIIPQAGSVTIGHLGRLDMNE